MGQKKKQLLPASGPWHIHRHGPFNDEIEITGNKKSPYKDAPPNARFPVIADVHYNGTNLDQGIENARLIAASPALYDALELLLCFEAGDDSKAAIAARNKGRKALAQAKGEHQ